MLPPPPVDVLDVGGGPSVEARPDRFTIAFFHRPEDLPEEVGAAGPRLERLVGVEGSGGWLADWPGQTQLVLEAARLAEDIAALSAHMLAIARR